MRAMPPYLCAAAALGTVVPPASASLAPVVRGDLPALERAVAAATAPDGIQAAYDAARAMRERLRTTVPARTRCRALHAALVRYADARVLQLEGMDRPSAADVRTGARAAARARAAAARAAGGGCAAAPTRRPARAPVLEPAAGRAFFGPVVARAPRGADAAVLEVDGAVAATAPVRARRVRFTVNAPPGPHDLRVRFRAGDRPAGSARAPGAVLLPASAARAPAAAVPDPAVTRSLEDALGGGTARRPGCTTWPAGAPAAPAPACRIPPRRW